MKGVKNLLTGMLLFASLVTVLATSVREYQNMTNAEKTAFLLKETNNLLVKVKAYDPQLEQKTRSYMLDETNDIGGSLGLGAVLDVIDLSEKKRPETMDKLQVETVTKIVFRNYWKSQSIVVPSSVLGLVEPELKRSAPAQSADNGGATPHPAVQP